MPTPLLIYGKIKVMFQTTNQMNNSYTIRNIQPPSSRLTLGLGNGTEHGMEINDLIIRFTIPRKKGSLVILTHLHSSCCVLIFPTKSERFLNDFVAGEDH